MSSNELSSTNLQQHSTPVRRIQNNLNLQDGDIFESNCSNIFSPGNVPTENVVVLNLKQQIDQLKKKIVSLQIDLESEQELRYKCESENEKKEAQCLQLNQLLEKFKKEAQYLNEETTKKNFLEADNTILLKKNVNLEEKWRNINQTFEETSFKLKILENEKKDLKEEVQQYKQQKFEDKSIIAKLQDELQASQNICTQLDQEILGKDEQIQVYLENIKKLSEENLSLREELNRLEHIPDVLNSTPGECMSVVADIKISELNQQIADMTKSWLCPQDTDKLMKQCENIQNDFHLQEEKLKEVQQSLTVFKEQNLNLTKQVNKSIQDIADKEKHISLLLSQIDSLKSELNLLEQKLSNISFKLDLNDNMHQQLKEENFSLKNINDKLNLEIEKTKDLLIVKEKECNNFEDKLTQTSKKSDLFFTNLGDTEKAWKVEKEDLLKNHHQALDKIHLLSHQFESISSQFNQAKETIKKQDDNNKCLTLKYNKICNDNTNLNFQLGTVKAELLKVRVQLTTYQKLLNFDDIHNSSVLQQSTFEESKSKNLPVQPQTCISDSSIMNDTKLSLNHDQNSNLFSIETSLLGEKDTLLGHDKIKASIATNQASTGPKLHHQPSFFGLPVLEEPDFPQDWESLSLKRIAELQSRNSKQLAHLKSSYPTETQGKTPSRCDETVRVGDPRKTLLLINQKNNSTCSNVLSRSVDLTSQACDNEVIEFQKHQKELKLGQPLKFDQSLLSPKSNIENIKPVQPSTAFDIPNTPQAQRKALLIQPNAAFEIPNTPQTRKKTLKRNTEAIPMASRTRSHARKQAKAGPLSAKILTKSIDRKKKVLSSGEKIRKPFGRLNLKK